MEQKITARGHTGAAFKAASAWRYTAPQPEFLCIAAGGEFTGSVLETGCGTGENTLFLASQGHDAWGIDGSPDAIREARANAARRHIDATFKVCGPLDLAGLGRRFDSVVDGGFFHVLSNSEREMFVKGLREVLRIGGIYHLLCLSELENYVGTPRRVSQKEIRSAFSGGWRINYIRDAMIMGHPRDGRARAWLSSITRLANHRLH